MLKRNFRILIFSPKQNYTILQNDCRFSQLFEKIREIKESVHVSQFKSYKIKVNIDKTFSTNWY